MTAPDRSLAGQIRRWWPHCDVVGQPLVLSAVLLLRVGSLHSGSIFSPKAPVGVKVPWATVFPASFLRGSTDWPSVPTWVRTADVEVEFLLCQKKVAVLPCV